jgi:hypothetical protein
MSERKLGRRGEEHGASAPREEYGRKGRKEREQGGGNDAPWKVQKPDFPTALGKPAQTAGFPHFHPPTTGFHLGQKKKTKNP